MTVTSSADGLKSSKEDVSILSGKVSIKAGNDAVQAATALNISGGTVTASGDRGFTLNETACLPLPAAMCWQRRQTTHWAWILPVQL